MAGIKTDDIRTDEIKAAKKNHAIDMTEGSPYRLIFRFSMPLLLGNLFQQLYNTVDSMVVGNYVGTKALAAVGVGFPFLFALVSLFMGLGIAATVMISQRFGAKDYDGVQLIVNTIYRVARFLVVPMILIGLIAARPVLVLMRVPDDGTLAQAVSYIMILFAGMFATMGYNLNAGLLQGLGDSITSLKFLVVSTILNIVLDLLFVAVFHMGVAGAALATILAQIVSWVLGILYLNRHYAYIHLNLLHLDFDRDYFRQTLKLGLPMALQNVLFSLGIMAMNSLVNSYGSTFIAGFNGANKLDTLVFLPVQSFTNAITTFTGQNAGARRLDRIRDGLRAGLVISGTASILLGTGTYFIAGYAMRLFGQDPGMIEAGVIYLHSVLPFYLLLATLFCLNSVLRGVNQVTLPLFSTVVSLLVARVPVAYFLAAHFGRDSIFYSYAIGWFLGGLLSCAFYFFGNWQEKLHQDHLKEDEKKARERAREDEKKVGGQAG